MLQAREHQVLEAYQAVKTLGDQLSIARTLLKTGKPLGSRRSSARNAKSVRRNRPAIDYDLSEMAVPDDMQKLVGKLLKRKDKHEALGWLTGAPKGIDRGISEMDNRESIAYVRHLYKLGVEELDVVKIDSSPDGELQSSDNLIAKLPDDPRKRKAIFAAEGKRTVEMGYDPYADSGQRYLWIWFD